DVALEVSVATDDFQPVAAAEDADRQHSRRMNQFAWDINWHVPDGSAPGRAGFPFRDCLVVNVFIQGLGAAEDLFELEVHANSPLFSQLFSRLFSQCGSRFSIKARSPSTASGSAMSSSRYMRSSCGRSSRSARRSGRRAARTPYRRAAGERARK